MIAYAVLVADVLVCVAILVRGVRAENAARRRARHRHTLRRAAQLERELLEP